MASIERRGGRYRVRWRERGRQRSETAPTMRAAREIRRQVEHAIATGQRWERHSARAAPDLGGLVDAFARDIARCYRPATALAYARTLDLFLRYAGASESVDIVSKALLRDWYDHLRLDGQRGGRGLDTCRRHVQRIEHMWRWAADDEQFAEFVPPPRSRLVLPRGHQPAVRAPTWAECDAVIGHAHGWMSEVLLVMRFTGLRVQQAMALAWDDLDLEGGRLRVRSELGKTAAERKGRTVPVSGHLLEHVAGWGRREGPLVDTSTRRADHRIVRSRDTRRLWERTDASPDVYDARPNHAFRKAFVTELRRAGADRDAVEYLVGHSLGVAGVYIDPDALPLRETVALIPAVSATVAETVGAHPVPTLLDGERRRAFTAGLQPNGGDARVSAAKPRNPPRE